MLIRPAVVEDAKGIDAVRIRAWNETYRGMMPDVFLDTFSKESRVEAWRRRLTPPQDRYTFCVAVADPGEIVGFAVSGPAREEALKADGEVYAINLAGHVKRQRLGARLMQAMAEGLIGHGFRGAGLWVIEQNVGARAFYERLSGVASAQHEHEFGGKTLIEIGYAWADVGVLRRRASDLA